MVPLGESNAASGAKIKPGNIQSVGTFGDWIENDANATVIGNPIIRGVK